MATEIAKVFSADLSYKQMSDFGLFYRMTPTDEIGSEFLEERTPHWFIVE